MKKTVFLGCIAMLAVTSATMAGTYAISDPVMGIELRTGSTPYPAGWLTVPAPILTRIRNGSLSASQLTPDGVGGVRQKTENDLDLASLKVVVQTEIDTKTESLVVGGVAVTITGGTYTFDTTTYSQMNIKGKVIKAGGSSKVRLVKKAGASYSVNVTSNADLKKIQDAIQDHVDANQQAGWVLKENLEAATDKASVMAIRAQNNAR